MLLATISVTVGDLLMSQAMRGLGPLRLQAAEDWLSGRQGLGQALLSAPGQIYELLWLVFGTPRVWMAIGCMLVFLLLWMVSLSWSDLTFVMPLTALTYVLNAILVGPVLGEYVSPTRWAGTVLIAIGVALVTFEKPAEH
jgi:drug/metabolite transporter (DMT)-like permease